MANSIVKGGAIAAAGLGAWATADAVKRPDLAWDTAGKPKRRWVAMIAGVPVIGPIAYPRTVRPTLLAAQEALRHQGG